MKMKQWITILGLVCFTLFQNVALFASDNRGTILMVVSGTGTQNIHEKPVGYEQSELAEAYYVFQQNGFDVEIGSLKGGKPTVELEDSVTHAEEWFLADESAQQKINNTKLVSDLNPEDYVAIFFVGGDGAMYDFPESERLQAMTSSIYENGGTVGGVCHGPAAFVNVKLSDGSYLIEGKKMNAFTDEEELTFNPNASQEMPFLLESKLKENGALFNESPLFMKHVEADQRLVTGQNPFSTYAVAEAMVRNLGYEPVERSQTDIEEAIEVVRVFLEEGKTQAKAALQQSAHPNTKLIGNYAALLSMTGEPEKSIELGKLNTEVFPDDPNQFYRMGKIFSMQGQQEKSIQQWKKAVELDPQHVKSHYNLGKAYSKQGHKNLALAHLKSALQINPDYKPAKQFLDEMNAQS